MSKDGPVDQDFANLPPDIRADIEGASGVGLHHAPDHDRSAEAIAAEAEDEATGDEFNHPERDVVGTEWAPNWEPLDSYADGDVVMLDDGNRQMLGKRDMGMWIEVLADEDIAQPDYLPMLWSAAPERIERDMMRPV